MARRDWLAALLVFLGALALRIPWRGGYAYHWDSAQFALGLEQYDLAASQPHAPGYPVYVWLGRLLLPLTGDPHAALVWVSMLAGSALAALGYLLGRVLFSRGAGLATAAILATGPLCWFHSDVALTTIVDGALVAATVVACWWAIRRPASWLAVGVLGLAFALTAGVRQQTGPVLLPVWCYTFTRLSRPRWPRFLLGAGIAGLVGLAWLWPAVQAAGGVTAYLALLSAKASFDRALSPWGGGLRVLLANVGMAVDACWTGLLGAGVLAVVGCFWWYRRTPGIDRQRVYQQQAEAFRLLAWWAGPMLVFSLATCLTMPGYVLNFFPAVAVLAGVGVAELTRRLVVRVGRPAAVAAVAVLVIGINGLALAGPERLTQRLLVGLPLRVADRQGQDRQLAQSLRLIRSRYPAADTVVCHQAQYYFHSFRHFQYHLPAYRQLLVRPDPSLPSPWSRAYWLGYRGRTRFVDDLEVTRGRRVLLVVPPGERVEGFGERIDLLRAAPAPVPGAAGRLFECRGPVAEDAP